MTLDFKIKPITVQDFDSKRLAALLKKSQTEGFNLVLRLIENWENGSNRFDKNGEAFFCAENDGNVVGVGGRSLDPYLKDKKVVRVRHVYVTPTWRGLGVGSALMSHIMDVPPGVFNRMTLRTLNPLAARFYERLGFKPAGDGPVTHDMQLV